MSRKVYLPDTNMLQNLAEATLMRSENSGDLLPPWQSGALNFFDRYGAQVQIPSIVWGEFCGLWFHKNVDFANYDKWFENRLGCFGQTYRYLKERKVEMCDDADILYRQVLDMGICLTTSKMPAQLIAQVTGRLDQTIRSLVEKCAAHPEDSKPRKDLERNEFNRTHGKLLDGLDSVIMAFACAVARQRTTELVVLVTQDRFMVDAVAFFYNNQGALPACDIPPNVTASLPYRVAFL